MGTGCPNSNFNNETLRTIALRNPSDAIRTLLAFAEKLPDVLPLRQVSHRPIWSIRSCPQRWFSSVRTEEGSCVFICIINWFRAARGSRRRPLDTGQSRSKRRTSIPRWKSRHKRLTALFSQNLVGSWPFSVSREKKKCRIRAAGVWIRNGARNLFRRMRKVSSVLFTRGFLADFCD